MKLAELKSLAEAASRGSGESAYDHPRDSNNWVANRAFNAAFDADTALKLIAVAEAARYVAMSNGFDAALPEKKKALLAALEALK